MKNQQEQQDLRQPSNTSAPSAAKSGLSMGHIFLILGVVAIVSVAVVAAVYLLRPEQPDPAPIAEATAPVSGAKVITEANVKEIGVEVEEKVAQGMFETHMNVTWTFPTGESPSSDAIMGNAASNNYDFYFTVTLPETNDVVFTSGIIPVGAEIEEIKLEKDLDAGTYPAVVTINMVDENGEPLDDSNMAINVTLIISA